MTSDQENIDLFNQTANNATLWRLRGQDLHTAATVLRQKAHEALQGPEWSNPSSDESRADDCFRYAGLLFQSAMLQGFAVECLLKWFWIAQGNTVAEDGKYKINTLKRENHDLVAIAEAVGFALSNEESEALAKLSEFARSFGRYPIAKKWSAQRFEKSKHGAAVGPSWNNEEHQLAEAVLTRLKTAIVR